MTLFEPSNFIYAPRNSTWAMTAREARYQREQALARRLTFSASNYADQVRDLLAWQRLGDAE